VNLSQITGTDLQTNIESVARLFGDWGVETKQQGEHLNMLHRLSQETGVDVSRLSDQMVQFGSPLRQLGFDFETSAAMFAKFEKEGVNVQTLMPGLKLGLGNLAQPTDELAKKLRKLGIDAKEPDQAFRQVMDTMGKMKSDQDRLGLAMDVFGKRAGADLAAAVDEGRFSFDDLIGTMKKGDGTINKSARETRDFSETWEIFKNKAMLALEPIATRVFNALADGMEWLSEHQGVVTALAIAVGGLTASFVAFKVAMGIASVVRGVVTALALAKKAVLALSITTRAAMLATGIGALVVVAGLIIMNWDKVKKALASVWGWIKGAAKDVAGFVVARFQDVIGFIKKVPGWIKGALATLWEIITWPFKKAGEWIGDKIEDIIGFVKSLPGRIKDAVAGLGAILFKPFTWAWEKIKEFGEKVKNVLEDILEFLKDVVEKVKDAMTDLANSAHNATTYDPEKHGTPPGNQKGGAFRVPGTGSGDKVPVSVGGVPFRMLEPGELLFALNKRASGALSGLEAMNSAVPRFGGSGGSSDGGGGSAPRSGAPQVFFADLYIGGEKIDERVEVRLRENDRAANHFSRAGLVPG
jgi:TP901 family phage tail tape measure protein